MFLHLWDIQTHRHNNAATVTDTSQLRHNVNHQAPFSVANYVKLQGTIGEIPQHNYPSILSVKTWEVTCYMKLCYSNEIIFLVTK